MGAIGIGISWSKVGEIPDPLVGIAAGADLDFCCLTSVGYKRGAYQTANERVGGELFRTAIVFAFFPVILQGMEGSDEPASEPEAAVDQQHVPRCCLS